MFLRRPRYAQFCYINAAFSPAPDDTVGNLYKVDQLSGADERMPEADAAFAHLVNWAVLRNSRDVDSQLQRDTGVGIGLSATDRIRELQLRVAQREYRDSQQ